MKASDLKDLFRAEIGDTVAPYLWSDTDIAAYMDDAQKMFCRLVGGFQDATSMLCTLDIITGEVFADIDSRILRIRRAQRDSDAQKLSVISFEDADMEHIQLGSSTGPIEGMILGLEEKKVRWNRVPLVDDTVSLVIERLPMNSIASDFKTPLELRDEHHQHLMLWMKHRAYGRQDSDTYDEKKANDNETRFRAYCDQARKEKEVRRHKTRVVHYGGL